VVFDDLNLQQPSGSIIGLLGKNGTGKTTLLHLVSGLLFPSHGSIEINGFNPQDRQPAFLSDIYFVPEDFYTPDITIDKFIKVFSPFYPKFDVKKCKSILTDQGLLLSDRLDRVSTGQRKKFIIAFALSTGCRMLLFDEPTNGLDIPSKAEFKRTIASSVSDDQTIIIATHQVKDIELLIDRVLILDEGRLKLQASIWEIGNQFVFAHVPDTEIEDLIYSEKSLNGYKAIFARENDGSTVDLELLFNAVVSDRFIRKVQNSY
jgi:ABC-2 type transport system ATP-binding protein